MGLELTTLVVIGTGDTCSCKSNYHTITTMTAPKYTFSLVQWCVRSQKVLLTYKAIY